MRGDTKVYQVLNVLNIDFEYYEHPPVPTAIEAEKYRQDNDAAHCKNLFFRNHKGNRHFLVILEYSKVINVHELEHRLKQGKLTLASEKRLVEYLGLLPGSVSPFGLVNDHTHCVHVFIDETLRNSAKLSFHPNLNTASLVITQQHFQQFLNWTGNEFEFVKLYE